MLDTQTKRRIDDCRDILVGKLPDPKAQIEQITIGLIYKFMDDMDKEAIELGGSAKFFSDDYAKYSWDALFDTKVTAAEMLKLYSEAIESMEKNPNIPQLFRDIFNNAYLPYRDPETLKMFLKTIGEFEYTHSEKLGDAFEYLLSVMGSQGDAGQFRTPRHIIDFLVAMVDPKKTDTILDPACGTAGFLISAFKHIMNCKDAKHCVSTPEEQKRLIKNFAGYDISPDMVRLSLVNLYLHGFAAPHIHEYDTLSSEERWDESFDVVLANPPFMSPKGGIRPHKKFTIQSNRSEVLFVDYIAEHLNPKGRAGIIVPEGVIFQSGKAYKALRKMLVENHLYAVVSLPAGVFNPYSGVKTSILLMDREFAKTSNEILFVKIDNDGFNLGAQRNAVKGGQLEEAIDLLKQFKTSEFTESPIAHAVLKSEIAKNGDYNLSGERYKVVGVSNSSFQLKKVSDVCLINPLKSEIKNIPLDTDVSFVPMASLNQDSIDFDANEIRKLGDVYKGYTYLRDNDVLIAKVTPCFENGKSGIAKNLKNGIGFGSSEFYVLRTNENTIPEYIYRILQSPIFFESAISQMTGTGGLRRVPKPFISDFQIPLPPLSVQEEIVSEIEVYQKIIDGAKMVVENYKPKIDIDPAWEMVELGEVCKITSSKRIFKDEYVDKGVPFYRTKEIVELSKGIQPSLELFISTDKYDEIKNKFLIPIKGDILVSAVGTLGVSWVVSHDNPFYFKDGNLVWLRNLKGLDSNYLKLVLDIYIPNQIHVLSAGAAYKALTIVKLKQLQIPVPPQEIQNQIVAKIGNEKDLVNSSKQIIEIFEQKIKDRIAKVWGEDKLEEKPELSLAAESVGEYKTN